MPLAEELVPQGRSAELRQRGYDGIIAGDVGGNGLDYMIALERMSIKVVLQ